MSRYDDEALDRAVAEAFGRVEPEPTRPDELDRAVAEAFGREVATEGQGGAEAVEVETVDARLRAELAAALGTGDEHAGQVMERIRHVTIREGLPRSFFVGRVTREIVEAAKRRRNTR